ncbi:hypothetical protein C0T31_00080 [Dysgonamonadaceae bacterium]|nr:hypothetical protein C0T31_00080 [Dysgonamonadaceae bacterium]
MSSPERNICHTCFGVTKNRFIFATNNEKFLPKVHFKLFENLRDDYFHLIRKTIIAYLSEQLVIQRAV